MHPSLRRALFVAVVILLASPIHSRAAAAVANLQAAHDNTLYQTVDGSLSNGSGVSFFAGTNAESQVRRGLISFDVASIIPAGSTINSVSLTLHLAQTSSGAQTVSLHRLLAGWGEGASSATMGGGGGGAPAAAGDATWLHTFFPGQFWTTPGGDFDPAVSASQSIVDIGFYTFTSAQLAAEVQQWLDNPAGNFGWLLRGNESTFQTTKRFDSRESTTLAFRPVLTIDFTPVPAPGAALLLGAFAMRRRRR